MYKKLYSLFTQVCHFGYKSVRFTYEIYKKVKAQFKLRDSNPYQYISLHPTDLTVEILSKNYKADILFPPYTTITPVLNEEKNITEVLKSIESQTLLPDQVIIIDAQSDDRTVKKINEYKKSSKLNIEVITSKIRNIGHQRNIGIKHSRNNIIVNVDAGTFLDKNYGLNIVGPFVDNDDLDMSIGIHHPKIIHPWSIHFSSEARFYRLDASGACIAYKRDIAIKAGGYPEYITYAGEDTLFCYRYKKLSKRWIFSKKAIIFWEHPNTFKDAQSKVMNYMMANFEIGLWPYFYNGSRFQIPIWLGYFFKIFRQKFPTLLQRQTDVDINNRHIKGLRFILSNKRITDPSNTKIRSMAIKLISDNYKVFFIDFATSPPEDTKRVFIDTDHTLFELMHYTDFNLDDFQKRYGNFIENSIFIIENSEKYIIAQIEKTQEKFKKIKVEYL